MLTQVHSDPALLLDMSFLVHSWLMFPAAVEHQPPGVCAACWGQFPPEAGGGIDGLCVCQSDALLCLVNRLGGDTPPEAGSLGAMLMMSRLPGTDEFLTRHLGVLSEERLC